MPNDDAPPDLTARIAAQVRRWRLRRRMTQRDLGLAIGAGESYISTIENTPRMPSFLMGMRIVRKLGIHPEDLLAPLAEDHTEAGGVE